MSQPQAHWAAARITRFVYETQGLGGRYRLG